ncbi:MAG: serine hydroxymethyltransferase, partial [Oscillibacter sp.]|nr:serine hydroxymethyltransferase [Oscillibacter sp.]
MSHPTKQDAIKLLDLFDPEMADLLHREEKRQFETIGLIASENVVSPMASALEGSVFTNKNTEGYPGKRFVGGCQLADQAELLALERVKKAFGAEHANIQSGNATIANMAVLTALLNKGDTFMGLTLDNGGHLSHGAKFHYSGREFNALHYGVNKETEYIDMDQVRQMALEHKPKLIVTGASSYPRMIDYKGFREICDEVGAYFWVDCAHDCGLIAGGAIPSPIPYADVVTTSTQKTMRGPRGCGIILCKAELATKIDRAVFPRIQGGPKGDMLAARGVLFYELLQPEFKAYAKQVCLNAKALAQGCKDEGL